MRFGTGLTKGMAVHLPGVYLAILLLGIVIGWRAGPVFDSGIFSPGGPIVLNELAWPLAGVLMGMAFYGAGPLVPLLILGIHNGNLVSVVAGGAGGAFLGGESVTVDVSRRILDMNFGLLESFAFLYGAIGGMYLAMYQQEMAEGYEAGMIVDETQRWNFMMKSGGALFLAFVVMGLRVLV